MAVDLPARARVVIVGGGVIGCSIAYHLGKLGWSDVVLLERKQLTSGTTWHAAGLIGQLRQSMNMTRLARYTAELYRGLEAETGQATGYRQCGSISLATTPARMEELSRNASMAKVFGLPVHVIGNDEIRDLYPLVNLEDVIGGIHIPSDGYANAVDVTQALAKGARCARRADLREDEGDRHPARRGSRERCRHRARAHRRGLCGAVRWNVDPQPRGERRRDRPPAGVRALLRAVQGRAGTRSQPAGAARLRPLQLFQVRRGQASRWSLRAACASLGHGRHPGGF